MGKILALFRRRWPVIVGCLVGGILLFLSGYMVDDKPPLPELEYYQQQPPVLTSVVPESLTRGELDKALRRLNEKLLGCKPPIVVDQRWEVMRNGSYEWSVLRFQGEYQEPESLVPLLRSCKEYLARDFNLRVLIQLDRKSRVLNLIILDKEEVVVVGNFTALHPGLVSEPEDVRPRLAIVIDDMGHNLKRAAEFSGLPLPLTFAIFPLLKNSLKVASLFVAHHRDIILHAPMEPRGYPSVDPGPGALFISMGNQEVNSVFLEDLQSIPGIIGVNNHMGSRLTADPQKMDLVIDILKNRNLFFLDSRTIADSVAYERAKAAGIPALQRDIFLDNVPDIEHIVEQLQALIEVARVKGRAIGIGHPYPVTAKALALLPEMAKRAGIKVVAVREMVAHQVE
ncbi:MAG: divergent polysaccharide deacetylase family protein [Deltaproteobacteria bacterium]|nr:divergent polysaccharide deacetylase family protein [Candidatus Tharpella sp.]